ncbi:autotransporter outer membrane beta-barrel domain-containing protein [Campylobacter sp. IFREMER_LSEM_CL2090]|uniref:autotransporter outer membrane beta-barrel domain-containing protein n=1 Tax=Campylobacter sp. IFREMER_LSEM_CL2090 TaxID=2911617 RepID=UPI0021E8D0D9|nr:autotransporter outer membrane beta-barrel domain-containing protein [Campylobacter sp. IFREMER_LSEM_CL2090]MCV3402443.1 autotransporter outer membrane beta-barrel domain-containing protein [Campylobacter sp. IFREMER_LSEM_CL2090]
MKLSYYTSKVLMGVSISALLSGAALAQNIDIQYTGFDQNNAKNYFNEETNGNFTLKNEYTNNDLTLNIKIWDIPNELLEKNSQLYDKAGVKIDLGNNDLTINNIDMHSNTSTDEDKAAYIGNFNISAKNIYANDIIFQALHKESVINGNIYLQGSKDVDIKNIAGAHDDRRGSTILIGNGIAGTSGSLSINGDLNADKTGFVYQSDNRNQVAIKVNGNVNITNSIFSVGTSSFSNLKLDNFTFIQADNFNKNIIENQITASLGKDIYSVLENKEKLEIDETLVHILDLSKFVNYNLSISNDGKHLLVNGGADDNINNNKMILESEKEYLSYFKERLKEELESDKCNNDIKKCENIYNALNEIKNKIQNINEIIASNSNVGSGEISNDDYIKNDSSVSASNKDFVSKILDGLILGKDLNAIGSIKFDKVGEQVANDIKDSAKSISNVNQASSGINSTINVSNDVSIGSRVAMLNNPYGNYATKLSQIRFATNDYRGNYVDNYNNSIWGNVIGGANIIDGDSGALYGATIGMDRKVNDDVIIGAYFTYANAEIKDNLLTQKSDNFQFGAYSNIHISPKVEVSVKAYAQISPTDQDIVNRGFNTTNSADFNRKFLGLSANMGYIFDFSNNTLFIKPFAGANYYYAHTPSYKENGIAGKDVNSASNNSISLELGAEFRKYMSETSYLFITPKIEQYVMNNGDDYVASLNGVALPSVKSDDKKKTYGQIIIGGNVDISEQFSLNAGIGAKQILAGKTDGKNETYVSGQVGFKYKF